MKEGLSTARQYQGRPMNVKTVFIKNENHWGDIKVKEVLKPIEPMTCKERHEQHLLRHPNDKSQKKTKGIFWGKKGYKDAILDEFYETHVYTFIDADMNKGWVYIGGEEE